MEWIWKKRCVSFDTMTNIPLSVRKSLATEFLCTSILSFDEHVSQDGTRKYAFHLSDGSIIESVLIPAGSRVTACISTQVGCALACGFCATGMIGFIRNLTAAEIHDEIVMLMNLSAEKYGTELDNIVAMGMGEPLLNYPNTISALNRISAKDILNFSPQRITISTSGIADGIKTMADDGVPYHLAISLHTAIERKRLEMMPVTKKYSIPMLTDSLKYYHKKTNNRFTIEYILFDKLNDGIEDAEALARFCKNFPVKINLIPYNSTDSGKYHKSSIVATENFIRYLKSKNIIVNLRASKGGDIKAACGQLALTQNKKNHEN